MEIGEIENIVRDAKRGTREERAERSEMKVARKRRLPYILRRCATCRAAVETTRMIAVYGKSLKNVPPIKVTLLFRTCRKCGTTVQDRQLRYINRRERAAVMARLLAHVKKEGKATRAEVERMTEILYY